MQSLQRKLHRECLRTVFHIKLQQARILNNIAAMIAAFRVFHPAVGYIQPFRTMNIPKQGIVTIENDLTIGLHAL